ncbi:MAG: BREX-4 system phosphatase PglZ [Thermoguttaceae bacterium]|nr:BREX-4 system phosphatase PglZ [Thermoguttaceae bacterium]
MKTVNVIDAIALIRAYLENSVEQPFFVSVDGTEEYNEILDACPQVNVLRASEMCANDDSWMSVDALRAAVANVRDKTIALGVGDVVALGGSAQAVRAIKGAYLPPGGKLVVLCRGARKLLDQENEDDPKFDSRRYCRVEASLNYVVTLVKPGETYESVSKDSQKYSGFKALVRALEDGEGGRLYVATELPINVNSEITTAYAALKETAPEFGKYPEEALEAAQWRELADDPSLDGHDDLNWRSYLRRLKTSQTDPYLALVYQNAPTYAIYRRRLFNALLDVGVDAPNFDALYNARKKILAELPAKEVEREINRYIRETLSKNQDRFRYLTDATVDERRAIIAAVADLGVVPQELANVYPALYQYASRYDFVEAPEPEAITEYFEEYKRCKLFNRVSERALELVNQYATAQPRPYATFDSRAQILVECDKNQTALYWLDALGVDYLAFLCKEAYEQGLRVKVRIGAASLPTTTEWNNKFYEEWQGQKYKIERLDDLLHGDERELESSTQPKDAPYYLASALEIIEATLNAIRKKLDEGDARKVLLVSDHGATRAPAVIENARQRTWEFEESNGCNGGRSATIVPEAKKPPVAAEGNGFWCLANYDRFKGGSLQGYETHGGATLEEVLVPIIELSLAEDSIELRVLTQKIEKDRQKPATLEIETSQPVSSLELRHGNMKFPGEKLAERRYKFTLDGLDAKSYQLDAYEGDNKIDTISITIAARGGQQNDSDFDFFN